MKAAVSLIRCDTYDQEKVSAAVAEAVALQGGISTFVKPGSRVLVKPNLLVSREPERAITTHPAVVRAVVRLLKTIGCTIYLGDGPSAFGNHTKHIDDLYEKTGMAKVALDENIELVRFDKGRWRGTFPLATWLDKCDCLVSVPKFKTHELTTLTGALKNTFGLVTGNYKTQLHLRFFNLEAFAKTIVDIYEQARPVLSVVDGITAMEGEGPGSSGTPRECGVIVAGSDGAAIDSVLASIMGLAPRDIPTTREAAHRGLGVADLDAIAVLGASLASVRGRPFVLPTTSILRKIPRPVIRLAKKLIRFYPCVEHDHCVRCAACIQACPNSAMTLKENRIHIDCSRCIACFCCQETCPESAIKIKKSLLARLLRF